MNLNINNWIKLLFIAQLTLSLKYKRLIWKIININSPNEKILGKIELFKKYNKKDLQLKKKDKVYLQIKNLKNRKPLKKLNYVKIKPFLINK